MFKQLRATFQNSFVTALLLLVILVVTLLSAIAAVLYLPTSIGEQRQELTIDEMYHFNELSLDEFDYLGLNFPKGGFLVPAYNKLGSIKGLAIIGDGEYHLQVPNGIFRESGKLSGIYYPTSEERFALLLLKANYTEVTSRNVLIDSKGQVVESETSNVYFDQVRDQAKKLFVQSEDLYLKIQLFGYKRVFLPASDLNLALLTPNKEGETGNWRYYENRTVSLFKLASNEEVFSWTNENKLNDYPHKYMLVYATITLSLLLLSAVILVLLLTIDIDEKRRTKYLVEKINYPLWAVFLAVVFHFASQYLLTAYDYLDYQSYILIGSLYVFIILAFCKNSAESEYLGLNFKNLLHSILAAVLLGFFFQIMSVFNVPVRIAYSSYSDLLIQFVLVFFFQALINELVFRGIIQNFIERLTTTFIAILVTAGIVALINFIVYNYLHQNVMTETVIQAFLVAPLGSLVLSFLYVRTRSILASALLATFLVILPKLLIF